MSYDKFCKDVLGTDNGIRFVALGNRNGELIGSSMRQYKKK